MKKILIATIALFVIATSGMAQKFIDVYQNGRVAGSMFSADIDSINITGTDASRRINFWGAGRIANSFSVTAVDSIKVFRSEDEPLVYLGILGFNQAFYPKAIDILASSTSSLYTSFVGNLTRKEGTLLYYGVDQALDILTQYDFTTPLSSVNLITFTDGLDQGSLMMTTDYEDEEDYLTALSNRIGSTRVRGLPLTAYSLGMRGNDVTNYTQFQANLRQLATSADKAIEVTSMNDVQNRLQEIADQIISISNRQTISMKIPGQSNGTRIRFTFDGNSPDYSTMYIEGTFNLSDRSLRDVTYHGIRGFSGAMVEGVQDGIFVTYTFTGLQRTDGNGLIPTSYIRQYNQAKGSTTWQINSEFTPGNNTQTTITHSGAAIMLVLDCSSSLGSQFGNMQSYAQNFISRVANNAASFNIQAPTNVIASLDDNDMVVNISWDAVKYAEYYKVYRSNYSSGSYTLLADSVMATSWKDENPMSGDNYYRIYAFGHGLTSSASNTSDVVQCVIEAPQNVKAALDDNEFVINVSWDAVKYAESYTIYRNGSQVAEGITSAYWRDDSPRRGANYYTIYAVGNGLKSSASNNSETVSYIIGTPQNIKAVLEDNVVTVSWNAVRYAEKYTVYRRSNATSSYSIVAENITGNSWCDRNISYGIYYYEVVATVREINSSMSSPSNAVVYSTVEIQTVTKGIKVILNGVPFTMVKVRAGTFQMGEEGVATPVHQVTLTNDYYIGETEVTQELWKAVMGSNPSFSTSSGQHPADCILWSDCKAFISNLNILTGKAFRLPSEAEWEFAARGGNVSKGYVYSGSNIIDDVAWYIGNSSSKIHEVATKAPNELGIYDMSGNVWEWCQDWYGRYSSGAQTNPGGPVSGSYRIIRGGGGGNDDTHCHVANRHKNEPNYSFSGLGLRIALSFSE